MELDLSNRIAGAIMGVLGFLVGRWRGWWSKAKDKRETRPSDGKKFTLLVAELEGDEDKKQTGHVIAELEKQFPPEGEASLYVISYPEVLSIGRGERSAALETAQKKGRDWLYKMHGDVLIWGEVADKNKVLRLRFVTPGDGSSVSRYSLNEKLELPPDFGCDLGAVLAAQAATAISPVCDRGGEALAALIAPIVAKLKPLAECPPVSFSDETQAQLWHAYAAGEARLGEEHGDIARFSGCNCFLQKDANHLDARQSPAAMGHDAEQSRQRAWIARRAGERHGRLEEAVAAYRAALPEWTRDKVPLRWATTQNNLGTALLRLGERESGTAQLEEAVVAYSAALLEWTREQVPLQWATTQNNLGNALAMLGEREAAQRA